MGVLHSTRQLSTVLPTARLALYLLNACQIDKPKSVVGAACNVVDSEVVIEEAHVVENAAVVQNRTPGFELATQNRPCRNDGTDSPVG